MHPAFTARNRAQCARFGLATVISAAALAGLSARAVAEDAPTAPSASTSVHEVIVTATKRATNIQRVPSALAAVDSTQLVSEHIENIQQLKSIPAFNADTSYGRDQNQYYVRGVNTYNGNEGTASAIAVYQDETYLDSPSFGSEPLYDIDRVEVLYGPQGTLWGQNSTGGAINIVTRQPTTELTGYGKLTYGSYNELDAEGAVSGPLVADKLFARISFVRQASDGWILNKFNNQKLGDFADEAIRMQLLWKPNEKVSFLLKVKARDLSGNGAATYFGIGQGPSNTNVYGYQYSNSYNTIDANVTNPVDDLRTRGVSLVTKWDLGFAELMGLASYDKASGQTRFDDDATPVDLETFHNVKQAEQENLEVRLTSTAGGPISWIAGATFFNGTAGLQQQFYSLLMDYNLGDGPYAYGVRYSQDTKNYGVYGSFTWRLTRHLSLIAGGRYTYEKVTDNMNNVAYLINPVSPEVPTASTDPLIPLAIQNAEETSSEPTGDVTLQYQPTDAINLYAKISRGYRGGGFNQVAFSQAAATIVRPEFIWAYEGGFKTTWLNHRLKLNGSVYHYDFSDIQEQSYVNNVNTLFNAATGKFTGGEIDVRYSPTDDLDFSASYAVVDRHIFGYQGAGPDGNIYNVDFHKTTDNANLSATYRWRLGAAGQVELHTDWNYAGTQYWGLVILSDPIWNFLAERPYWKGDASISYRPSSSHWELSAWVKNLTDQHSYGSVSPYPYYELTVATHGMPRTYGLTLSASF